MEVLEAVLFLTVAGERLAEWLLKPFTEALSSCLAKKLLAWLDDEHAQKVANCVEAIICAIPGFAFSMLARLDAFAALGIGFSPPIAGMVITAIFVGGGSNLVHIFVDRVQTGTESLSADMEYWKKEE